jgi:hypothetical protein
MLIQMREEGRPLVIEDGTNICLQRSKYDESMVEISEARNLSMHFFASSLYGANSDSDSITTPTGSLWNPRKALPTDH